MLTQEQMRQYLQRIDYHGSLEQEISILSALQWSHLTGPEELGGILKQYFGLENISYLPPR